MKRELAAPKEEPSDDPITQAIEENGWTATTVAKKSTATEDTDGLSFTERQMQNLANKKLEAQTATEEESAAVKKQTKKAAVK